MRPRPAALLATLTAAVVVSASLSAPAGAATPTSASAVLTDEYDAELSGVRLTAVRGTTRVELGETGADGRIAPTSGTGSPRLSAGTWTFVADDVLPERVDMEREYAPLVVQRTLAKGTRTDLGRLSLKPSGRLIGNVLAPSGLPLRGVGVTAVADRSGVTVEQGLDTTLDEGAFLLHGIGASPVRLRASRTRTDDTSRFADTGVRATVASGATTGGLTIKDWRVRCTTGLTLTSSAKRSVRVGIRSTAAWAGIDHPGGDLTLKRGSTTIKKIAWSGLASSATTLTRQPTGKHSYSVSSSGGDCAAWSRSATVSVRS